MANLPLITDCLGDPAKKDLLKKYELRPVLHTKLLKGKSLTCCCGGQVTTTYYQFDAFNRTTGVKERMAYGGNKCAPKLIELSKDFPPPIVAMDPFNPFQTERSKSRSDTKRVEGVEGAVWDPFNRELHAAINLILIAWDVTPGPALSAIRAEIEGNPSLSKKSHAKSLNTVLKGFCVHGTTLTSRLDQLRLKNPKLKDFPFTKLREALETREDVETIYL